MPIPLIEKSVIKGIFVKPDGTKGVVPENAPMGVLPGPTVSAGDVGESSKLLSRKGLTVHGFATLKTVLELTEFTLPLLAGKPACLVHKLFDIVVPSLPASATKKLTGSLASKILAFMVLPSIFENTTVEVQ